MSDYSPEMIALATDLVNQLNAILTTNQNWKITPQANGQLVSQFPGGSPPPPPPPTIATIPNYTNLSAAFSVNLAPYVTNAYTSLQIVGTLPTGWTFAGTTLSYSGTGSGSAAVQLQANWSGTPVLSNTFTVQSVATVAADTIAPTIPTGVVATQASNVVTVVYNPSSDPAPPSIGWTGVAKTTRTRTPTGGSFAATAAAASNGLDFFPTAQDIGSPAIAGSTSQTGPNFTMTGYGAGYYGTADQGQIASFAVTGNFIVTFEVAAFTCANIFAKCGVDARGINPNDPVNGSSAPHAFANIKPLVGGLGGVIDYRATQGGPTTNTASVATVTASVPLWIMFSRIGNVFTMWQALAPNALGTAATQCGQVTVVLPAQIYVGPVCAANGLGAEASCTINQWNISQDTSISFTDTAVIAGNSYSYQITATDNAGNVSAASPAVSITMATSGGGGGTPSSLLVYLQGLAGQIKHVLVGQHCNYWDSNPMDCVTPIPGVAGGKQVTMIGTSNFWLNSDGVSSNWNPTNCKSITNAWLAQNGIVVVTQGAPVNAGWLGGAPVTDIYTPGKAANTKWNSYLQTNVISVFNSFTGTCLFRAFPECNNNWGISALLTPAQYILMWQYTYNYCMSNGMKNVLWMFNLNDWDHMNSGSTYYSGSEWYPGSAYVDIVSFDAYPPGQGPWDTVVYNFLVSTGKPVMLGEFGYNGTLAAGNIDPILQTVKSSFPKIIAMPCWCQSAALYKMPDVKSFMTDPAVITLSDLPAGI